MDESLNRNQLTTIASKEASNELLRLADDRSLESFDVFQEYPHAPEWRKTQLTLRQQSLNSDSRRSTRAMKKTYYLILDICLPMLQLKI